jgi:hypothetical protein
MLFILKCEMCYYRSNLAELLEKHVNSCHVEHDDIVWTVDPNNNSPRTKNKDFENCIFMSNKHLLSVKTNV